MENVQYVFLDPGINNVGLVIIAFNGDKVDVRNYTLDISDKYCAGNININQFYTDLQRIIYSFHPEIIYYFHEKNSFYNNVKLSEQLGSCGAALEMFMLQKKDPTTFLHVGFINSLNVAQKYGLKKKTPRETKKHIFLTAFKNTFAIKKATNHEADAFAAGAAVMKMNSNSYPRNIQQLVNIFYKNVEVQIFDNITNNSSRTKSPDRICAGWSKKCQDYNMENTESDTDDGIFEFQESTLDFK